MMVEECFKFCESLKEEAYFMCVERCYGRGHVDRLALKMAYASYLNDSW